MKGSEKLSDYTKLERIKTISSSDDEEVIEAAVLPPWAIYGLGELNEHTLILLRAFKEAYCKDCEYNGCSCTNENFCIGKWGKECTECSTCEHKKIAYIDDIKICVNRGYINCPLENKECESEVLMEEKKFKNALIKNVSISMADHGVLTFYLTLDGDGWGTNLGGYMIGKGYLGAKEFKGDSAGIECLMRIMDTVGVHRWEDLKGKYVRVADADWGDVITEIGHITKDKWFNIREFFTNKDKEE